MEENLIKKMNEITKNIDCASVDDQNSLNIIKAKLVKIQQSRCEAAAIRARVGDFLMGEKYSANFLGREKQKQEKLNENELIIELIIFKNRRNNKG